MILKSYAKLNVSLEILEKRPDSYHNLKTIFERISLADTISLKLLSDPRILVETNRKDLPGDKDNLVYRAAELLQRTYGVKKGVAVRLHKCIPVGAGLGGGSSNAATVLGGLNRLWKLGLSRKQLAAHAGTIGSDVPFFVYDCPFAAGLGRGEIIRPLPSLRKTGFWHILVVPRVKVSTPLIYRHWDARESIRKKKNAGRLTKGGFDVKILSSELKRRDLSRISSCLYNSLERVTAVLFPVVCLVKKRIEDSGMKPVLMSGSGPAVFGIAASREDAVGVYRQLKKENRSWEVFVARTI
ncbi:MAG: 4-(cytidine 5'-diphospho)-2-C-methyl-D-erythritol kinase [Candidatus Omnitrophica bacterium]|nr:4-(cytidine 5'-diphospho)-2-C-methyl-D-erythritol kinase [Candidatus Omnitrophota bacterium]